MDTGTKKAVGLHQIAFRGDAGSVTEAFRGVLDVLTDAKSLDGDLNLSGAIALSGTSYFQVLEGEFATVEATLARIQTDPRHDGIKVVSRRPIACRSFKAWSLAYPAILPSLKLQIDLAISACEADCDYAIALLRSVIMTQRPAGVSS